MIIIANIEKRYKENISLVDQVFITLFLILVNNFKMILHFIDTAIEQFIASSSLIYFKQIELEPK